MSMSGLDSMDGLGGGGYNIRFRHATGDFGPYTFPKSCTVLTLKEKLLEEWPKEPLLQGRPKNNNNNNNAVAGTTTTTTTTTTTEAPEGEEEEPDNTEFWIIVGAGSGACGLVVIFILCCCCCCCARKRKKEKRRRRLVEALEAEKIKSQMLLYRGRSRSAGNNRLYTRQSTRTNRSISSRRSTKKRAPEPGLSRGSTSTLSMTP